MSWLNDICSSLQGEIHICIIYVSIQQIAQEVWLCAVPSLSLRQRVKRQS